MTKQSHTPTQANGFTVADANLLSKLIFGDEADMTSKAEDALITAMEQLADKYRTLHQSRNALVAALREAWNAAEGMRHTPDAEIAKAWGQLADKWSAALAAAENE